MEDYITFIDDLNSIKKLYNSCDKLFLTESISEDQRKYWNKIIQSDFCRPSDNDLKQNKEFNPLMLKKSLGHKIKQDEYIFNCSYRTSQDFWNYEDKNEKVFAKNYPYIEEIIRFSVFVKMEPLRCMMFIFKLLFEKYWKYCHPLKPYSVAYDFFVKDFEENKNTDILLSGISREHKNSEKINSIHELFSIYYPSNFYSYFALVLKDGKNYINKGITNVSVTIYIGSHIIQDIPGINEQEVMLGIFESIYNIIKRLSQFILDTEGPKGLNPVIDEVDQIKLKLNILYNANFQNKQKGIISSDIKDLFNTETISLNRKNLHSSGIIDKKVMRLLRVTGEYDKLSNILKEDPLSVYKS